jgi:hypothetical protein
MLCRSPVMGCLALFSQFCHYLFLRYVEMPHVKKLYGDSQREDGALWRIIKQNARKLRSNSGAREQLVDQVTAKIRSKAVEFTRLAKEAMVDDLREKVREVLGDLDSIKRWIQEPSMEEEEHNSESGHLESSPRRSNRLTRIHVGSGSDDGSVGSSGGSARRRNTRRPASDNDGETSDAAAEDSWQPRHKRSGSTNSNVNINSLLGDVGKLQTQMEELSAKSPRPRSKQN